MRERFIEIFENAIHRKGAKELLEWLDSQDFFTAPASTKYHLAKEGGLCEHSIHVYERLRKLYQLEICNNKELTTEQEETVAIVGLLHDLCKVKYYDIEMRNKKIDGQWQSVPTFTVNDVFPFGHGEKSVYLINLFMRLTTEGSMAIRWHMGFSDNDFRGGGYGISNAFSMYKLPVLAHIADLEATYLDESE